jgi:hypothetical protein
MVNFETSYTIIFIHYFSFSHLSPLPGLSHNASFIFSVWDHDTYNADDLIGVFTIPMRDIIKAQLEGKAFNFVENLHSNRYV